MRIPVASSMRRVATSQHRFVPRTQHFRVNIPVAFRFFYLAVKMQISRTVLLNDRENYR